MLKFNHHFTLFFKVYKLLYNLVNFFSFLSKSDFIVLNSLSALAIRSFIAPPCLRCNLGLNPALVKGIGYVFSLPYSPKALYIAAA